MKILAIKLRHIGDNLLAGAALGLLKRSYPEAQIHYMVPEHGGGADLLRALPAVDEVIEFPKEYSCRKILAGEIRRAGFDLSVDFSWDTRSAAWGLLSGAPCRLGYYFRKRIPAWPFYTRACAMGTAHTALANIELVGLAGATARTADDLKLSLYIPPDAQDRAGALLKESGINSSEEILVIHPTSRWSFKSWSDDDTAKFLDQSGSLGLRPVLTAGPSDVEREKVSRILGLCRTQPACLAGRTDLLTLAALIARAKLFVGVDSAPVHIAAAVGTPVVALFGPSGQKEWYPWQVPFRTIQRLEWSCCPCARDGCAGTKRSRCLEDIRAEEVIAAAAALRQETFQIRKR